MRGEKLHIESENVEKGILELIAMTRGMEKNFITGSAIWKGRFWHFTSRSHYNKDQNKTAPLRSFCEELETNSSGRIISSYDFFFFYEPIISTSSRSNLP